MNEKLEQIQELVDFWSAENAKDRAQTQMTLGKLIDILKNLPEDKLIGAFGEPHSYRGYYSDLAFEPIKDKEIIAKAALKICEGCMGEVFEGYKGGDFQMDRNTPIWFAFYGSCGRKIMSLNEDGTFETEEDDYC
jgi:hypothetical protein